MHRLPFLHGEIVGQMLTWISFLQPPRRLRRRSIVHRLPLHEAHRHDPRRLGRSQLPAGRGGDRLEWLRRAAGDGIAGEEDGARAQGAMDSLSGTMFAGFDGLDHLAGRSGALCLERICRMATG